MVDQDIFDRQEEKDLWKEQGYYSVFIGAKDQRIGCSAKSKDWLIKNAETRILNQIDLAKMTEVETNFLLNEIREEVRLLAEEV